jgi:hypothetical protein
MSIRSDTHQHQLIKSQVQSELCVELNQTRRSDRSRPQSSKKTVRQTSIGVVKFTEFDCLCLCVHCDSALAIEIIEIAYMVCVSIVIQETVSV